jgi:putative transposase
VTRAEDWPWSSLGASPTQADVRPNLASEELLRRGDWAEFVNQPMTEAEVEAIGRSINRSRPYGTETWTLDTAERLGLEFSLRSRGGQRREVKVNQNP